MVCLESASGVNILFFAPAILEQCLLQATKSELATAGGWPASANWRKLCNRVPEHEKCNGHGACYLA